MELRQLEIFRAIAEELHFGRAAQRLFLAQASVSQQLQRLEAHVGVRLVDRSSRSVRLTPAGKVFLVEAERVLSAADRAVDRARQVAAGRSGALRIATNYPASRLLLLPLLEDLRAQEPGLTTMLREMSSPDQLRALRRGDLDLALVYGPVAVPGVASSHLLDVPVVAVVRPGHPLAERDRLRFDELLGYHAMTGYEGGSRVIEDAVVATAAVHGTRLPRSPSTTDLSGYLLELETSDAIGFCSLPRAEQNRANGMRVLRLVPAEPVLPIHVAWNESADEPLVNRVVAQLVRLAETVREVA
ncbi:LysR family transcriptional regulator [Myceligenerans pegani]|uniref:LysR family transcriptional regulator n=1 Tax=Myceligenerans pegani TaxID=2776917 RepID=A0ABR9MZ40_9MICO|nr:LysR substrate-binding domain-containing protein [Myceligenerans sp. TRM 65318]MBE1876647.1 LysR family transcriptional regulator [Myceligenerans sp. TRM 65318]MBE3018918.1 LysR family transcriptional regulator [Myceligenerans sp. TRM 65318]